MMTINGHAVTDKDMQTIAVYMDDDIREAVHNDLAPCTHDEFIAEYLKRDPEFIVTLEQEFSFEADGEPEFSLYHVVDRPDGDGAGDWFDIIETDDRGEALKAAENAWNHMSAHDRNGRVVQVEEWHDEMGNADIIAEYK